MKSKTLLPILILIFASFQAYTQVESIASGGLWSNPATWIGNTVPATTDSVIINGTVSVDVNTSCLGLLVRPGGILQNHNNSVRTLTVNSSITNNGAIRNNNYNFLLDIEGDMFQHGTWENYRTKLTSTSDQNITFTQVYEGAYFENSVSSKTLIVAGNLWFDGTRIDLGNAQVQTAGGAFINVKDYYLANADFISNDLHLSLSDNAYLQNLTTESVELHGIVNIGNNVIFNGYATNHDTLQNRNVGNQTLTVNAGIKNNGLIRNNSYYLTMAISGELFNAGTWDNHTVNLTDSLDQTLIFGGPLSVNYFNNNNTDGELYADSDIEFHGTNINMNADTMTFTTGQYLILNDADLEDVHIVSQLSDFYVDCSNGAYIHSISIDISNVYLQNVVQFNDPFSITGSVVNNGTLRNRSNNNETCYIYGDFTNNGSVVDNSYYLIMYVSGNILQNGTWSNRYTYLNGSSVQQLEFPQPFTGQDFISENTGNQLSANSDLQFINTNIDLNSDTLIFLTGGDMLMLSDGHFKEAAVEKTGTFSFELNTDAYYENCEFTCDSIILSGTIQNRASATFNGNVNNTGTFTNSSNNNYSATINGNQTNNGTITSNYYSFDLNISGNIFNHGSWNNRNTNLIGSQDQGFNCSQPVGCSNLINSDTDGRLIAHSGLEFQDVIIDLNNDTLIFEEGNMIAIQDGKLDNAVLINTTAKSASTLTMHLDNTAYLENVITKSDTVKTTGAMEFTGGSIIFDGNLLVEGKFRNRSSNSYSTTITGSVINNDTISNNYYNLTMYVGGDIHQNGLWNNDNVFLNGTGDQHIWTTTPFNMTSLEYTGTNGILVAESDLIFNGVDLDFNNDTIAFEGGTGLELQNSSMEKVYIIRDDSKTSGNLNFTMTSNSDFQQTIFEADTVFLNGTVQFQNAPVTFNAHVVNLGTLRNFNNNTFAATINGSVINQGQITNNYYNLDLSIAGDIYNHGTWTNDDNYLTGTADQNLMFTQPFEGEDLIDNDPGSNLKALSDLSFIGTDIDLGGVDLYIPLNAILSLTGVYLVDGSISSPGFIFNMNGNSYMQNISAENITLSGTVRVRNNVIFSGVNQVIGTLQNYGNNNYILQVDGDLENNGIIENNYYSLYLTVTGDIANNGTWQNSRTLMDGSTEQNIDIMNGNDITGEVRLDANVGSASVFEWFRDANSLVGNPDFSGATSSTLEFDVPVSTAYTGIYNCQTNGGTSRNINVNIATSSNNLDLTLFLEGPFDSGIMDANLNAQGVLPLNQPYNAAPWNYTGTENVASIPNANVIDWVLIELRDASDAGSATSGTMIHRQAAFLLNDGSVVDLDGSSLLSFSLSVSQQLFVVVWHRNHLGIMSASGLTETGGTYSYDFSAGAGQVYGSNLGHKEIGTGIWGMIGGDGNADGQISNADKNSVWVPVAGSAGYLSADFDMDSQVNNGDKNDVWIPNGGTGGQVPNSLTGGMSCQVPE